MAAIQRLAASAAGDGNILVLCAGAPVAQPPPNGLTDILRRGGNSGLGVSGGLTLTKHAAAFTRPQFVTTRSHERVGSRVDHYAVVQRTTSADATHECYYPAAGDHLRPGMTQQIGGQTYNHYWRISDRVAALIRQGEQEHLDDDARAYELTYKRIENAINELAGRRFGPASTPAAADRLAEAALVASLPSQLGADPANWVRVLDRLLSQTRTRDTNGWHALSIDPPRTIGNMIVHPVSATPGARIGRVPSNQVVNY
ncbi:MAG: hypothetical protein AAB225_17570 [Acidobacteriota bacterium]